MRQSLRPSDGSWTTVQVHEVTVEGDHARLVISTGHTPELIQPDTGYTVGPIRDFQAGVRVAGGLGPYDGQGTLPAGTWFESGGDQLLLRASLRDGESGEYTFAARDAAGNLSNEVTISVTAAGTWTAVTESLFQGFLESDDEPLTPGELSHLDEIGNANGLYDVGDLRKWLREND